MGYEKSTNEEVSFKDVGIGWEQDWSEEVDGEVLVDVKLFYSVEWNGAEKGEEGENGIKAIGKFKKCSEIKTEVKAGYSDWWWK